jgi:hypothetical protein
MDADFSGIIIRFLIRSKRVGGWSNSRLENIGVSDRSPAVSVRPHCLFTPDLRVLSPWILQGHASRPRR